MTRRHSRPLLLLCVVALALGGLLGLPGGTVDAQGVTEGDLDSNGGHHCTQGDFQAGKCPAPDQYFCYTQACDPNNAPSQGGETTTTTTPDIDAPASPSVDATSNGARVDLTAFTEPEAVIHVRLEDGTLLASGTADGGGTAFLAFDMAAGEYLLLVTAIDKAGNNSEAASYPIKVAGPPPNVPGVGLRAASPADNDTYLELSGQPAARYEVEIRNDGGVVEELKGSLNGDGKATAGALLPNGGYSYAAILRNGSGDSGQTIATFDVSIGAPPPPAMLLASDPGSTPVSLDLQGPKQGTATLTASLDGTDPVAVDVNFNRTGAATAVLDIESDGAWNVSAQAVDFQDNSSDPALFEDVVVDTQGPLLELETASGSPGVFAYVVKTDVGSSVMVESDTAELQTEFVAEAERTEIEAEVPEGEHSIAVTALDDFGNESFDTLNNDSSGGGGLPILPLLFIPILVALSVLAFIKRMDIRDWWYNRQYH